MPLPTTNITTTLVRNKLGSPTNNVDALCTYVSINMWSKRKPVRDPRISIPLNEVGKGSDNRFGLNIPSYVNGSYPLTTYNRPRGADGYSEPSRLGDFRGYYHGVLTPPVTIGSKPNQIETTNQGVSGVINLQSMVSPGAPLIGLSDLGLRVCAMFYSSGTNFLIGWASAPDSIYGGVANYIAYKLSSSIMTLDIKFSLVESYHSWKTTAIPSNLPMWEIPRQFSGQNGDWIGVPIVFGSTNSISSFGVLGYLGQQRIHYSIASNYSFTARIEITEEGRSSGLWYHIQNIPVVANVTKTGDIFVLSYPLVGGKKYTANLYDGNILKSSHEIEVGT